MPERMPEGEIMTYGYSGEALLPVTVTGAAGPITARANWLVSWVTILLMA